MAIHMPMYIIIPIALSLLELMFSLLLFTLHYMIFMLLEKERSMHKNTHGIIKYFAYLAYKCMCMMYTSQYEFLYDLSLLCRRELVFAENSNDMFWTFSNTFKKRQHHTSNLLT